ncbi:MAG: redoxin domain-containing protein [Planctomycetales bacterium]|nr:redoxin domain-containing protein [Planctomycetales bacterium]
MCRVSFLLATFGLLFGSLTGFAQEPTESAETDNAKAATADEVLAGHSYHGEAFNEGPRQAAFLMDGTGNVHFPVDSEVKDVQAFIDQGIGQLHGFWYFEAERTFRQAAFLDPDCAAAYWGMAMANANNRERAVKFCEEAVQRKEKANGRVRMYIEALSDLLNADQEKKKEASEKYIKAMEKIVYEYPDDIEAKAFIALHLWDARKNGVEITSHLAVDALIGEVLAVEPMHPVHHYRIHLWDYEKPERALASSALCGQSAPAIAHMWHMPGHIYSRVKRYGDAVWQQEASARTDHAQMMRDRLLPDQIHNFAHNNEWCIRNMIFIGRIHDALDLAKNMVELPRHPNYNMIDKRSSSSFYGRARLLDVLNDAELWDQLIQLSETPYLQPTDRFDEQLKRLRNLGRAYFRSGKWEQGTELLAQLETQLCEKQAEQTLAETDAKQKAADEEKNEEETKKLVDDAIRDVKRDVNQLEKAIAEMHGYVAVESKEFDKALEFFKTAVEVDKCYKAQIQFAAGQQEEAIKDLEKHIDNHKNETIPLAHLIQLLWQAERPEEAQKQFEKLQEISSFIDLDVPPFKRLAPIAHELGLAADWRIQKPAADDVGNRPDLDSLGPFRWQPSAAEAWNLEDNFGKTYSLSQYQGKPVVVIFYLGFGCLHCVEQLHAFAPQVEKFGRAGISIIAISTEDKESLNDSLADFGGAFQFPIVCDPQQKVFKQYRAFDDFEQQPLHGTFLIDADGLVRWQDIGYEPFMDHEFVLNEALRIFTQPDVDDTSTSQVAGGQGDSNAGG